MPNSLIPLCRRVSLPVIVALLVGWMQVGVRAEASIDYMRAIKPLFAARCFACHGALKQKSGLRLDTVALMRKGGENGPVLVPGKADQSLILDHVLGRHDAARMPPEGEPLKPAEIALIKAWIDAGAISPANETAEADPKDHWAFKAPVKAPVPKVTVPGFSTSNPIDAFLAAEWEKRGLKPQPAADKSLLLRRVYLDLTGLPPTWEEHQAFLADTTPDAYEKVVDRLLASPQYGEQWGQHWMDIWRYSDWWGLGAEVRNSQKHMWHWRDWIIESLNADKGYDQMIREMLAADELYPTDEKKIRATGFLARQYFIFNHNTWMEETVEHTSKAFLGLTMNCTKCHDHKFDPLTQQDFYRFRAFFEPYQVRMDMVPGEVNLEKDGIPRAFDCHPDAPTYLFIRGDERQPRKDLEITPGVPALLAFDTLKITPVKLPPEAYAPGLRAKVIATYVEACESEEKTAEKAVEELRGEKDPVAALEDADKKKSGDEKLKLALAERTLAAAKLRMASIKARIAADQARTQDPPADDARALATAAAKLERELAVATAEESVAKAELEVAQGPALSSSNGVVDKKNPPAKKLAAAREAVAKAKKALESPGETYTRLMGAAKAPEMYQETEATLGKPFPSTSTGRRSALAAWLTDRRNPLPARVAVNHIWARHFGQPIVATVFDFGRKGARPTHPELLDYLAIQFQESGWSMKTLHRLMVTSNVYRMSSSSAGASSADVTADPENHYLWRMNPTRMESQMLRDNLLALCGELDRTIGGPEVPVADETARRRSVYYFHSHNEEQRFLTVFDDPSVLECYRRAESIVPQQALAMENSKLVLSAAQKIAGRIDAKDDRAFIEKAFTLILGSPPTPEELNDCEQAMKELQDMARKLKQDPAQRSRQDLIHALLNHNDFVTIR